MLDKKMRFTKLVKAHYFLITAVRAVHDLSLRGY